MINFDFLFTWSTFFFLIILATIYFSPLAKIKIGGKDAKPMLKRWRWFSITLTTTIATGILFWGTAEPMYHFHGPPEGLGIDPGSREAAIFAMSTMIMHWTITPYGIYTITGLLFALVYYNLKQPYSLGSLLYPVLGEHAHGWWSKLINMVCLYALVMGMAASMGTGILTIAGGLGKTMGIASSSALLGIICLFIVAAFVVSSATGLMKGIRTLSDWNIKAFIGLALFIFFAGPTMYMLQIGAEGMGDFLTTFLPRSTDISNPIENEWQYSWTISYWANWMAWAPITALFLGRIAFGYTVRDFINYNLLLPSLFGAMWMMIFSGGAMGMDVASEGNLINQALTTEGPEAVVFKMTELLPFGSVLAIVFLLIAYLSYVTAADSNTSAMSSMSTVGISPDNPESPLLIKVAWGAIIGGLSWVMISAKGMDGAKEISVLGGFPALFLIMLVGVGLVKIMASKKSIVALQEGISIREIEDRGDTEGKAALEGES